MLHVASIRTIHQTCRYIWALDSDIDFTGCVDGLFLQTGKNFHS